MNTISVRSQNLRKKSKWFLIAAVGCLVMAGAINSSFLIGTILFAVWGLLFFTFGKETVKLSHDVEGKFILVSTDEKEMVFPLDQVLNLTEGATYGRRGSYGYGGGYRGNCTNYYLTVRDNAVFGKEIKFTIYMEDIEYKDNYYILRREVITVRSKRAKERAYGRK